MNDEAVYRTAPATPGLLTIIIYSEQQLLSPTTREQQLLSLTTREQQVAATTGNTATVGCVELIETDDYLWSVQTTWKYLTVGWLKRGHLKIQPQLISSIQNYHK